jgi:hypothetical protein
MPTGSQALPSWVLCPLGFEQRCLTAYTRHFQSVTRKTAFVFNDRRVLAFDANYKDAKEQGFELIDYVPSEFHGWMRKEVSEWMARCPKDQTPHIGLDLSSMSRPMIADILYCLAASLTRPTNVTIGYVPAVYARMPANWLPVESSSPVTREFAGWSANPDNPSVAVVGLGGEYGRALGTVDFLDAGLQWVFFPKGADRRYDWQTVRANVDLLRVTPRDQILHYSVTEPASTLRALEALVYGLIGVARPVVVPLGPKIFSAAALLAALIHYPQVAVWRVSGGRHDEPSEKPPGSNTVIWQVEISPLPRSLNAP